MFDKVFDGVILDNDICKYLYVVYILEFKKDNVIIGFCKKYWLFIFSFIILYVRVLDLNLVGFG